MAKTQENPNAFKNWINRDLLLRMAQALQSAHPPFAKQKLISVDKDLLPLELKDRVRLVRDKLHQLLPAQYPQALKILLTSLNSQKLKSFDLWPYTEFVQKYGLDDLSLSLEALHELTQLFTSEFAVRPFLKKYPSETLAFLSQCAEDKNAHVRRWVSEGTRPRLPWGERLDDFIQNPRLTLPLLEKLKFDEELYVRKSVANHLNDISKDNPELVLLTLQKWNKQSPKQHQEKIAWITRHALRGLIKAGNAKALALIGVSSDVKVKAKNLKLNKATYRLHETIDFTFALESQSTKPQKIVIDYLVHHQKSNGSTTAKVFKLKTLELAPQGRLEIQKRHSLKPVTTRKYYPGLHSLEIQVNGRRILKTDWHLKLK